MDNMHEKFMKERQVAWSVGEICMLIIPFYRCDFCNLQLYAFDVMLTNGFYFVSTRKEIVEFRIITLSTVPKIFRIIFSVESFITLFTKEYFPITVPNLFL